MRQAPAESAAFLGRLPAGSVVDVKTRPRGEFVLVAVELEEKTVKGWVPVASLRRAVPNGEEEDALGGGDLAPEAGGLLQPKRSRLVIPKDEGLLLHRDPSILYGIEAGGNYGFLNDQGRPYSGLGFSVGAYVGMYFKKPWTASVLISYKGVGGTDFLNRGLGLGFFQVAIVPRYLERPFEVFAIAQFSLGAAITAANATVSLTNPTDASGFWLGIGGGYLISVNPLLDFIPRLYFATSINAGPLSLQTIGIKLALEFRG